MPETTPTADDLFDVEETEELLDHAEETLSGVILATAAFCRERDIPFADWVTYVGARLAPAWDEVGGEGAIGVTRLAALNLLASGGDLHALDGDEARAELRGTWPDAEDLAFLGLTRTEVDPIFDTYAPIAARLGLQYQWRREGEQFILAFAR